MEQHLITGAVDLGTPAIGGGGTWAVTLDFSKASAFKMVAPAANGVITVQNLKPGQYGRFKFAQDAVGGRTVTYSAAAPGTPIQTVNAPAAGDLQPAVGAAAITSFIFCCDDPAMATVDVASRLI